MGNVKRAARVQAAEADRDRPEGEGILEDIRDEMDGNPALLRPEFWHRPG